MTIIHDLPGELFRDIFKYCDKKSIINLGKVDRFFYNITIEDREKIKNILDDYSTFTTKSDKNRYIISCIAVGKIRQLYTLLELGILHPNDDIGNMPFKNSHEGRTAIDCAVLANNLNIIELFMRFGCDLDKRNNIGFTPLMICIIHLGNTEMEVMVLEFLLKKKANTNIEDKNGYIAMDYINGYDPYIRDLLRDYGSREGTEWVLQTCNEYDLVDYDYDHDTDTENYDESGDYDYDSDEEMSE